MKRIVCSAVCVPWIKSQSGGCCRAGASPYHNGIRQRGAVEWTRRKREAALPPFGLDCSLWQTEKPLSSGAVSGEVLRELRAEQYGAGIPA